MNPFQAVTHEDPYPYYECLVAKRPFYYDSSLHAWIASGAAVVEAVLGHPALRVRPADHVVPAALIGTPLGDVFARMARMTDGMAHAGPRDAAHHVVAGIDLTTLGNAAHHFTGIAIRERDNDAEALLQAVMFDVPSRAMAHVFGAPPERAKAIPALAHAVARAFAPTTCPQDAVAGNTGVDSLDALLAGCFSAGLERANAIGCFFQNYDATAGLIGNTLVHLGSRTRAERRAVLADPVLLDACVSGSTRWDPSVHNTRRFAGEDVEIAGERLAIGDMVVVILAAANLDPAAEGRIFTFGTGPHACLGARASTVIANAAITALARSFDPGAIARHGFRPSLNIRVPVLGTRALTEATA